LGHYPKLTYARASYHAQMVEAVELLRDLAATSRRGCLPSSPRGFRDELSFFAQLFGRPLRPAPDFDALWQRYWQRVYAIYDRLPGTSIPAEDSNRQPDTFLCDPCSVDCHVRPAPVGAVLSLGRVTDIGRHCNTEDTHVDREH